MSAPTNNNNNTDNDDFLARAQAATQRVAASAAVQQNATPEQAKLVEELAQDRPTIHAAVTSFLSLVAARSLVTPDVNQQQQQRQQSLSEEMPLVLTNAEALHCSRALLKAMNSTTLCATPTTPTSNNNSAEEYQLVAQLWNGLVASEQKPARFLGRRALRHAWADVKPALTTTNDEEKLLKFVQEFEQLLFFTVPSNNSQDRADDDAALIWSVDGGKAELQRRRERRVKRATEATKTPEEEEEDKKLPFIEELKEDEE